MGHRDTPEACCAAREIYHADGGLAASAEERPDNWARGRQELAASPVRTVSVRAALFALRFYKSYLSLLFAGNCRFTPTCSVYACQAIERFGVARGAWLSAKRLLRCQPFSSKYGFDPIPEVCTHTMSTPKTAHIAGRSAGNGEVAS